MRQSFDSHSMAIDSRTGAIYSPVSHYQLNQMPDINFRLQIARLQFSESPIKQCYNGLQQPKPLALAKATTLQVEASNRVVRSGAFPEESKIGASSLTLGFLTLEKDRQKKTAQQQIYCGFKPGFLNSNPK